MKGAGIVAGGPFGCAAQVDNITPPFGNPFVLTLVPRRVVASLAVCTHFGRSDFEQAGWQFPDAPAAASLQREAVRAHTEGMIDDPNNLIDSRVWLFHGDRDTGVPKSTVQELRTFYQLMGVPAANIELKDGPDAKHGMPIKALPSAGAARHCRLPEPSFLVRCDYGAAELLLQHLYPHAKPAATHSPTAGRIIGFDQTEFFDERDASTSLNETAISMCRRTAKTTRTPGQSAVCTWPFTVASSTSTKSTACSSETPDTMTGRTPITSSFFTHRLRLGFASRILARSQAIRRAAGIGGAIQETSISVAMGSKCALYAR